LFPLKRNLKESLNGSVILEAVPKIIIRLWQIINPVVNHRTLKHSEFDIFNDIPIY